jgi:hypothetical protein
VKWLACFILTSVVVAGTVPVYEHQPRDDFGSGFGGANEFGRWEVADDFTLPTPTSIDKIQWWGGFANSSRDQFVVRFFADQGGKPGPQLFETNAGNGSPIAAGGLLEGSSPTFSYSATVNSPFVAAANQRYWVSVVNPPNALWAWELSSQTQAYGVFRRNLGELWGDPYGNDAAFVLYSVPEAKTTALLCVGVILLFAFSPTRRRQE